MEKLLGFFVGVVTAAEAAIFAQLQAIRRLRFIFLRVVIAALAVRARHNNHNPLFFLCHSL